MIKKCKKERRQDKLSFEQGFLTESQKKKSVSVFKRGGEAKENLILFQRFLSDFLVLVVAREYRIHKKRMGTSASLTMNLPDRLDVDQINNLIDEYRLGICIDMIRFDLIKDRKDGTVSRSQALHLIENKLPPIYSMNGLVK
jgi:hypothetical protein